MKLVNLFLSFPVSAQFRIESKGEYLTFLFLNSILYVRSREIFVWCWSWFHKNTPSWRAAGRIQKRGRVFWSFRKMEKTTNFVEWFFYIFGYFGFPFIDFENLAKSELFFWLHVFKWFDGRTLEMKFECFDFWFKKCHYHFKMTWKIIYDHHHWNQATGVEVDQSAAEQYTNVHLIVGISSQQIQLECSTVLVQILRDILCMGIWQLQKKNNISFKTWSSLGNAEECHWTSAYI